QRACSCGGGEALPITRALGERGTGPADEQELNCQAAELILRDLAGALGTGDPAPLPAASHLPWEGEHGPAAPQQVETRLRLAEARYRTLVEQMPVVTFLAALDGGVNELYVSPQIEALL